MDRSTARDEVQRRQKVGEFDAVVAERKDIAKTCAEGLGNGPFRPLTDARSEAKFAMI
jgi:hypothetical protein